MIRLALSGLALLASDTQQALRFVGCPIYRDTDAGRKSGCWLIDDPASGVRYDVTAAPTKPDWNHAVLVEGLPAPSTGNPCGGVVIEPARVSVLELPCTRHMLKAEGFAGRRFALPARNVRPLYEARERPKPPFAIGRFTIPFDFGSDFIVYQLSDFYLDATINYALDVAPARIAIAGSAQEAPETISGVMLREDAALARQRADKVRTALIQRGVPADRITLVAPTSAPLVPEAFDGIASATPRRVDITITPE